MKRIRGARPSSLFKNYELQLAVRAALFAAAVVLFVVAPGQLDPNGSGLRFLDVAWALILLDDVTKFLPRAHISVGSLKQYRDFHLPTAETFRGGREALLGYVEELREHAGAAASETLSRTKEAAVSVARAVDMLSLLPPEEDDLTADAALRRDIRRRRAREVLPVLVFWVVANGLLAWALDAQGWLTPGLCVLWSLFYFLFDMVCVVVWCPLQLFLMGNRCCTTCQIFNWDAIMVATPLIFAPSWYSGTLLAVALVVLVRWELAFIRHSERFDERTNAALACTRCEDHLCARRGKLLGRHQASNL